MRYTQVFALTVVAFTTLLGGCVQDEIDKTRDEFAKQMKETRETLMAATKDFTTALCVQRRSRQVDRREADFSCAS
jgi:hypothetical protein